MTSSVETPSFGGLSEPQLQPNDVNLLATAANEPEVLESKLRQWLDAHEQDPDDVQPNLPRQTAGVCWSLNNVLNGVLRQLVKEQATQINFQDIAQSLAPDAEVSATQEAAARMKDAYEEHRLDGFIRHLATSGETAEAGTAAGSPGILSGLPELEGGSFVELVDGAPAAAEFSDGLAAGQEGDGGETGGETGGDNDSALGKRKRTLAAASLQNLQHKKVCPQCHTHYGNAKKGECGQMQPNGTRCKYVFIVKPNARSGVSAPISEVLPNTQRPLKVAHAQFQRIVNEAKAYAAKTGLSVAIFATGALHTSHKATEICDTVDDDIFIRNVKLPDPKLKAVTLKFGTGGAARTLANKYDVLDFITMRAASNLLANSQNSHSQNSQTTQDNSFECRLAMPQLPYLYPVNHMGGQMQPPPGYAMHPSQTMMGPMGAYTPQSTPHSHRGRGGHHGSMHGMSPMMSSAPPMMTMMKPPEMMPNMTPVQFSTDSHVGSHTSTATETPTVQPDFRDLPAFLGSVNCLNYLENLQKEDVDLNTLRCCGDEDLRQMDIPLGARRRILESIKMYK